MIKKLRETIVRFFTELFEETYVEMYVEKRLNDIIEVGDKYPKATHHAVSWAAHFRHQMKKRKDALYFIVTGDDVVHFKMLLSSRPFQHVSENYEYTSEHDQQVRELDKDVLPRLPDKVNIGEIKRIFTHKRDKNRTCFY